MTTTNQAARLSALLLCAGLMGCIKDYDHKEIRETIVITNAPDTNLVARLEAVASRVDAHIKIQDTNNAVLYQMIQQTAQRVIALEAKLVPVPVPPPTLPQVLPPLQSAPVSIPIEKGNP